MAHQRSPDPQELLEHDAWIRRSRRLRREVSVARPEAVPSSDTVTSEVELRRILADAMAQLEEPLQRALVLRFFHDCTLEVLAQREGIAVSTARARVERGLVRLRRALDRSN